MLERASARETAARVAAGAVARAALRALGSRSTSHVIAIGGAALADPLGVTFDDASAALAADDDVRCVDAAVAAAMSAAIDARAGGRRHASAARSK